MGGQCSRDIQNCIIALKSTRQSQTGKMAASSYAWLSVIVQRALTTVVTRKVVKIEWENDFEELLTVIEPGFKKEVIDKVIVSTNK